MQKIKKTDSYIF